MGSVERADESVVLLGGLPHRCLGTHMCSHARPSALRARSPPEGVAAAGAVQPPSLSSAWEELFGEAPPAAQEPAEPQAGQQEPAEEPPAPKPGGGLPL